MKYVFDLQIYLEVGNVAVSISRLINYSLNINFIYVLILAFQAQTFGLCFIFLCYLSF